MSETQEAQEPQQSSLSALPHALPIDRTLVARCLYCGTIGVWWECNCQSAQEVRDGKRLKPKIRRGPNGETIIEIDAETIAKNPLGLKRYVPKSHAEPVMAVTNITNVGSLSDDRTGKCNEDHPNVMETSPVRGKCNENHSPVTGKCNEDHPNVMENVMEAPPVGSLLDDRAENVMEKCNEDHPNVMEEGGITEPVAPVIAAIRAEGITSATGIAKALNDRGIPSARGGKWQAIQVQRLERAPIDVTPDQDDTDDTDDELA
jgi:hypothetical protein